MKLWIRVDAALPRDPEVAELAARVGIKKTEAIGLLVCVWSAIAEHRPSGDVSGISPDTIEDWAKFEPRGKVKRGTFAAAFEALFTRTGAVRGWGDRQGKLIERMEKDRKRKQQNPNPSEEVPRNVQGFSAPTERNGTEPYETLTATNNLNPARTAFFEKLPADYRPDFEAFLRGVGSVDRQYSWVRSMDAHLTGLRSPQVTPEVMGECLRQFVGNGAQPNWRLFERYLQTESAPKETGTARPARAPADDSKGRGMLILGEIRSKRISHITGHGVRYSIPPEVIEALDEPSKRALAAVGGQHKVANHDDDKFSILASQFAAIYAAAISNPNQVQSVA